MTPGWSGPATRIAPTTAMAEIAFVSDIKGVCSRRETRRMTSSPTNVASMKTKRVEIRSKDASLTGVAGRDSAAEALARQKLQTPSLKLQRNLKFQAPMPLIRRSLD